MIKSFRTTGWILFFFLLSIFLLTSGGRIAGSDETAFFLETQSVVENFSLAIPDQIVNNGAYGPDGKYYLGAGLGFTVVSIPFYLAGKMASILLPLPESYGMFVHKAVYSLINVFLCALAGVWFFHLGLLFGYRRNIALILSLALMLTTNLFVYAKSAMREPLLTLLLILLLWALVKYRLERKNRYLHLAGFAVLFLMHTKITYVLVVPLALGYVLYAGRIGIPRENRWIQTMVRSFRFPSLWILCGWVLAGVLLVFLYQYAMFGNIWASGYSQRNQSFSTPLFVGLYGLLFSSGKSLFLYAPVTLLVFAGAKRFFDEFRAEALFMLGVVLVVLLIHAKYFAWAGDGSWGPRYLIPVIPYLVIAGGTVVEGLFRSPRKYPRWILYGLMLVGLWIQIGGSAVYFGSYLRYIGEYPFQKEFQDPEFLCRSHFVPNYSPVTGHWELLAESVKKHWNGEMKDFSIETSTQRIPLAEKDQPRIVYLIDFWFMYAYYAGISGWFIIPVMIFLTGMSGVLSVRLYSVIKRNDAHAEVPVTGYRSGL